MNAATKEILYVDDSPDDRLFVRMGFDRGSYPFGLTIMESADRVMAELTDRLARGQALPALLVADHYMPGIDGPALLRLVRAMPELDDIVLATCSGSDDPADSAAARQAGARFELGKPLDLDLCRAILAGEIPSPA